MGNVFLILEILKLNIFEQQEMLRKYWLNDKIMYIMTVFSV